jgi:hypothetical protein
MEANIFVYFYKELKMRDTLLKNIKNAEEYLDDKDKCKATENFKNGLKELFARAKKCCEKWKRYEKNNRATDESRKYLIQTPNLGIMLLTSYIIDPIMAIDIYEMVRIKIIRKI